MFWFVTQPRPRASRPASSVEAGLGLEAKISGFGIGLGLEGLGYGLEGPGLVNITGKMFNGVYFEAPVGSGSNPMDRVGSDPASDGSGRIKSRFNGSPSNVHI